MDQNSTQNLHVKNSFSTTSRDFPSFTIFRYSVLAKISNIK